MLEIPEDHWRGPNRETFSKYWEATLRKNVAQEPDPAKRFTQWLSAMNSGNGTTGVRLIFIEQPYLEWAQAIEALVEKTEADVRSAISYKIMHPHED